MLICSVNKSLIKLVTDFGPLLVFFSFYYNSDKDLKVAIPPFIVATLIALGAVWYLEKKVPMIPLVGGILITFFNLKLPKDENLMAVLLIFYKFLLTHL